MAKLNWKIFSANRIGLSQLYEDAMSYIKKVYDANGQEFSVASPFAQIVNVIVNLGRMILFYIETSINELNIETAYQSRSIKGLSELTGHVPSRGVSARGSLYMTYNMESGYQGETIYIKNYTKIKNKANGLTYLAVFPTNTLQLTVGAYDSKIEIPIIQGEIKYQQGTGTGEALQSFNFANKSDNVIDEFFLNVYVNGTRWESVKSIFDMTYEQEACVVRSSVNGGIDVFFGTGNNGKIPPVGSTILCEYIVSSGSLGNVSNTFAGNYWEFSDGGTDQNGDYVDLNEMYVLSSASDIIFGTDGESIEMTRQLAPHASRSFVLANPINYKTFLSKLNMFSVIDAFSGFRTTEDVKIEERYNTALSEYQTLKTKYSAQIEYTGKDSDAAVSLSNELSAKRKEVDALKVRYDESKMDDNMIYLYLIPDLSKRLLENENYFTCPESRFKLTDIEKEGILNLIDDSGQRIVTVDNKIIDPVYVRFAMNIFVQIYNNYDFNSIKSQIIDTLSDYIINLSRRDRVPISDIIKIVESIEGVDSVTAYFDADVNNQNYFGEGIYGLDEYGDIVLSRALVDNLGNLLEINDVQPLFRGGFTSINGVYYEDNLDGIMGPINITLRGKTAKR